MISRCQTGIVGRGIASGISLPHSLNATRIRSDEHKKQRSSATTSADASKAEDDPWDALFEDIRSDSSRVPLSSPPRFNRLPTRFFSSPPGPKTFFFSNFPHLQRGRRKYGTDAKQSRGDNWDHLFDDVDTSGSLDVKSLGFPATIPRPPERRPLRRKAMTAREISAFDGMFDMIFAAVNKQAQKTAGAHTDEDASPLEEPTPPETSTADTAEHAHEPPPDSESSSSPAIGRVPSREMADFFGKLRSHSNRMRRTSQDEELLDRKKEEMRLCDTDQQLLAWATREVFPESDPSQEDPSSELTRYLADPTYPHVIAHLMHIFRTRYRAPHTSLAIFANAKRRSIHSYVFGCTTPAYNERLAALWQLEGWSGLSTLEAAFVEMRENGVEADTQTRALVERIRREIGELVLGREDDAANEAWSTLSRVEELVKRKEERRRPRKGKLHSKQSHWNEEWKSTEDPRLGEDRLTLQP